MDIRIFSVPACAVLVALPGRAKNNWLKLVIK